MAQYPEMTIEKLADLIPARTAQITCATLLAALGSQYEWNSDTMSSVSEAAHEINRISVEAGLPSIYEQNDEDDSAEQFWQDLQ